MGKLLSTGWIYKMRQAYYSKFPTAIIHTAAMTNANQCEGEKDLCWIINVKATEKYQIFFRCLSTDSVFNGSHNFLYG